MVVDVGETWSIVKVKREGRVRGKGERGREEMVFVQNECLGLKPEYIVLNSF